MLLDNEDLSRIFQKDFLNKVDEEILAKLRIGNASGISSILKATLKEKSPHETLMLNNFLEKYDLGGKTIEDFSEGDEVVALVTSIKSVKGNKRNITFSLGGADGNILAYKFNQSRYAGNFDGGCVTQLVMKVKLREKSDTNSFIVDEVIGVYDRSVLTEPVKKGRGKKSPQHYPQGSDIILKNGISRDFFASLIQEGAVDSRDENTKNIVRMELLKIKGYLNGEKKHDGYFEEFSSVKNQRIPDSKRVETITYLLSIINGNNGDYALPKQTYIENLLREIGSMIIYENGYM